MAMFRKAASILGRTVSSRMNLETSVSRPSILQAIRCMSTSKVFVGGLSYNTDEQALRETFDKYGQVVDARVIVDRDSARSRGFGFVTFSSPEEASSAIQALDQKELDGRIVKVNYANERPQRNFGDGGGGYGSGGYGGGGYGGGGYGGGGYNAGGGGGYGGGGYSGGGGGYSGGGGGYNAGGGGGYGGGGYNAGGGYAGAAGGEGQTGGGGFSYGGGDQQNFGSGGSYGSNTAGGGFENKFDGGADEGSYTPESYADKQA